MLIRYINYIKCDIDLNVNEKAAINNNKITMLLIKFTKYFDLLNQASANNQNNDESCHFINYYHFICIFNFSQAYNLLNLKGGRIVRSILVLLLKVIQVVILLNIYNLFILGLILRVNIHLIYI